MAFWDGSHDANVSHDLTYTGNLLVSSGNVLTVKSGATLTITGTLDPGWNGSIVIESGGKIIANAVNYSSAPSSITNNGTLQITTSFTIDVNGSFTSTGTFTTGSDLVMTSSADVDLSGSNTVNGNISATGSGTDFDLNGGALTVNGNVNLNSDGNVTIGGDMSVSGNTSVTGSGGVTISSLGILNTSGLLTVDNNGSISGTGILAWGTLSVNPNCSGALITCSGTSTSHDNNTVGWCGGTYSDLPANPLSLGTCTSASLPIELIEFNVFSYNDKNVIKWKTATEINNSHFIIEKSIDVENWEVIAIIEGAGNSTTTISYEYTENFENNGIAYYRLIQVDYDGRSETSDIVSVQGFTEFNIWPNPSKDGNFNIYYPYSDKIIIEIYDMASNLVYNELFTINGKILVETKLSEGYYLLLVKDLTNTAFKRILIQK